MNLAELFLDKSIKPKTKTEIISNLLITNKLSSDELCAFAAKSKDSVKASCIEALEFSTKTDPTILSASSFHFVVQSLQEKAPRIKWESARVTGNTAHRFPDQLSQAIEHLLVNSEHTGTVVRWSAAYALGEIYKMRTANNASLLPVFTAITEREEKNSIRKIYLGAMKKVAKQA